MTIKEQEASRLIKNENLREEKVDTKKTGGENGEARSERERKERTILWEDRQKQKQGKEEKKVIKKKERKRKKK